MVRHCLGPLRSGTVYDRFLLRYSDFPRSRLKGYCRWCGLPVTEKRRRFWDSDCQLQFGLALNGIMRPQGKCQCAECGVTRVKMEKDHKLAIFIARRIGPKAVIASFLLENMQWLCRACHKAKTAQEKRSESIQRNPRKSESGEVEPLEEEADLSWSPKASQLASGSCDSLLV